MYSTTFLVVTTIVIGSMCAYGIWYGYTHNRRKDYTAQTVNTAENI